MRKIKLCLLFTFFICTSFAATRNWIGSGTDPLATGATTGTDFNNPLNWDNNTGPLLATDDLIITLTQDLTTSVSLSDYISVNSLTITGSVTLNVTPRNFGLLTQNFSLNLLGNFVLTNSCKPTNPAWNNVPYNIIINVSPNGVFNIGANLTATNNPGSQSPNSIAFSIDGSLTVNGTTLANSLSTVTSSTPSSVAFLVGNTPAKIKFVGNVTFDDNTVGYINVVTLGCTAPNNTGSVEFDGNLSLGRNANTNSNFATATVYFDGNGIQTYTHGNTLPFNLPNVVIGSYSNSSTVLFANSNSVIPSNLTGNLTITGSSTLDLNTLQWNRNSVGGTFLMYRYSTKLKLSGATSVLNGGSATLFAGSNFP